MQFIPKRTSYLAHPLGAGEDREKNRKNAAIWGAWIVDRFDRAVSADWIWMSGVWNEEKRELGLSVDIVHVRNSEEIWLCGPRISPGMNVELHAYLTLGSPINTPRCVIDVTPLGLELPDPRAEAFVREILRSKNLE
jgi:hypothetical protein